jgi:hypothetical protein
MYKTVKCILSRDIDLQKDAVNVTPSRSDKEGATDGSRVLHINLEGHYQ